MKYRILGSSALRVSEVALGTMTFGETWGWGASIDESRRMLDLFVDRGGNFVDTANVYNDGKSEEVIGEWMKERGTRDRIVLSTKVHGRRSPQVSAAIRLRQTLQRSVDRPTRR